MISPQWLGTSPDSKIELSELSNSVLLTGVRTFQTSFGIESDPGDLFIESFLIDVSNSSYEIRPTNISSLTSSLISLLLFVKGVGLCRGIIGVALELLKILL